MIIRKATKDDCVATWEIFSTGIQTGDTYIHEPGTPKADREKHWFAANMQTFIVIENNIPDDRHNPERIQAFTKLTRRHLDHVSRIIYT